MEIGVEKTAVHLGSLVSRDEILRDEGTHIHLLKVTVGCQLDRLENHATYILNNATTTSVETKLSISGWIWRSMKRRRRGKMVIGPKEKLVS